MRINNNVTAMNTHRMYSNNNNAVTKSVSKLSSGYRINSAGDDAAGLAISEKMRAQIRGLNMASKNSQDAISLVQTAEGALQETHNILQRMRELAVQSGSDTNEQTIDRAALQQEFKQLQQEIDDIATTTRFNDQNLLDGTFQKSTSSVGSTTSLTDVTLTSVSVERAAGGQYTFTVTPIAGSVASVDGGEAVTATLPAAGEPGEFTASAEVTAIAISGLHTDAHNGNTYTLQISGGDIENMTFSLVDSEGKTVSQTYNVDTSAWAGGAAAGDGTKDYIVTFEGIGDMKFTIAEQKAIDSTDDLTKFSGVKFAFADGESPSAVAEVPNSIDLTLNGETVRLYKGDSSANFKAQGIVLTFDELSDADVLDADGFEAAVGIKTDDTIDVSVLNKAPLVIQSGANQGDEFRISIDAMNTGYLGVKYNDISTRETASDAITAVNNAINQVSTQRAALGAMSNRLEHKIANLDTSAENLQAAESRIRDVDMAKEMTNFTKNNILAQASTAMLAQANALPQGVLQLLG